MNQWFGGFAACVLGLLACNVEHYEDCHDGFDSPGVAGSDGPGPGSVKASGPSAGTGSQNDADSGGGAETSDTGGTAGSGGTASTGGTGVMGGTSSSGSPAVPCDDEKDCAPGHNCNYDTQLCVSADEETCGELATEQACTHRSDCTPVYAGTNCTCGQDCECRGGEPGCVCEAFQFFACASADK